MSHYKNKTSTTQRIYNFRKEHIYKSTVSDLHIGGKPVFVDNNCMTWSL